MPSVRRGSYASQAERISALPNNEHARLPAAEIVNGAAVVNLDGSPYTANNAAAGPTTKYLIGINYSQPAALEAHGDNMANQDELTDAKLQAVEARTDTKIAHLEGKLDTIAAVLGGKLDTANERLTERGRDRNLILGTIVLAALAVIGAFIGLATYGDALFGRGMNVRDLIATTTKETLEQVRKEQPINTGAAKP